MTTPSCNHCCVAFGCQSLPPSPLLPLLSPPSLSSFGNGIVDIALLCLKIVGAAERRCHFKFRLCDINHSLHLHSKVEGLS
ncbi:unnamed protein product [Ceratitis capitata]|uniref:(Mediterranean fruit fly) hypothetical protein n=1 Tax=Ceratitis capitata TaxID=7213 RepID=A0A811UJR0_CERCA|nr:unnamed protein product [Ceratitis capitata]